MIFGIIYWLTGVLNTLNDEVDVNHGFKENAMVLGEKHNIVVNSHGEEVLLLGKVSLEEQKKIWNSSILKADMLELFPRFSEIRYFIENHIEEEGRFKEALLAHIDAVETEYIGGSLTGQSAKIALSQF